MLRGFGFIVMALTSLGVAGCAVPPASTTPPSFACGFNPDIIELPLADQARPDAGPESVVEPRVMVTRITEALATSAPSGTTRQPAILALSGGSLHGAFGAGFLDGWRRASPDQRLPEFDVVTGISTGSILSTFAFIGDTERGVERYSITRESELLTPIARNRPDGSMSPFELVRVLRRGAVADLSPLRSVLLEEVSPAVMAEVARRHALGRKLYVGAVDVDNGQAMAFDLTQMATRYIEAGGATGVEETPGQLALRTCYVNAIIASSSAPLAAVPVFIDNRMYVDGGMRYGLFADDVIGAARVHDKTTGQHTRIFVLVNGDLETEPRCGKADPTLCSELEPSGGTEGAHSTWSLLNLALRSEQVLVNQVYRFSADRLVGERKMGNPVWFARIRDNAQQHVFTLDDPELGGGTRTCAQWHDVDEQTLHPIQFFPRYMHCLIDYGRQRGLAGDWNIAPLPAAEAEAAAVAVPAPKP